MPIIRIITFDKIEIKIDSKIMSYSNFVKNIIDDLDIDQEMESIPFNESSCSKEIIDKIIEYLNYYDANNSDETAITLWNTHFLDITDELLFKIIVACNYLDIKFLLDLTCSRVADIMKECDTIKNIKQRFNLVDDMTDEEENEIRTEYSNIL